MRDWLKGEAKIALCMVKLALFTVLFQVPFAVGMWVLLFFLTEPCCYH